MTETLEYVPIQCIFCFEEIGFMAKNHPDTEDLLIDELPILCNKCEVKSR